MVFPVQAILCTVDFSPFCSRVCHYGGALARRVGARLYLLHAVHHPQDGLHPTPDIEHGGDMVQWVEDATRRMHRLMQPLAVDWEPVVRCGDPVEQTLAVVNRLPPCLVISASHGVSGVRRLFIGTVVERLSRMLACPMLVIKPGDGKGHDRGTAFRSVVVSCDAHGHWQQWAHLLNMLAPDVTTPIHLVHALEGPLDPLVEESSASYAEAQHTLTERLIDRLHRQARRLFPENRPLLTVVAPGEPEDTVLKVAREHGADLIVVGVRPSGRVGRLISGSTTEALLRHAACCVLTVPELTDTPGTEGGT
jgi:nucleotide-binding universal stress UspA family protein